MQVTRRQTLAGTAAVLAAGAAARPARAAARPAGAAETVAVAIQYGIVYLPMMIADRLDLLGKHARAAGLDATLTLARMSGATAVNDALISGSVQAGAYGLPGLLIARERTAGNYGIRGLCALSVLPFVLFTNKPGLVSVKDIGPEDRIAVTAPNTPQAELLRMAAERAFGDAHRLDPQMVSLPHPDATAALIAGRGVSLYFATPPFISVLEGRPGIHAVTDGAAIMGEQMTGGALAAGKRFGESPLAAALVGAVAEACALIRDDPAQAASIYLASEPSRLSPAEVQALLRSMAGEFGVQPTGVKAIADFMVRMGELKQGLPRWQDAFFPPVNQGTGS